MTKHISACKVQREKARRTVLRNTLYNTNYFSATSKPKAMLEPAKEGDYKSPYLDNLDRRYSGDNDENTEMPDVKHITPISDHSISERTTSTRSRSGIQSIWSGFKSIKFDDSQGGQAGEPVGDEDTMAYMEDVPVDMDNDCYPFRYGVDYAWAKFL